MWGRERRGRGERAEAATSPSAGSYSEVLSHPARADRHIPNNYHHHKKLMIRFRLNLNTAHCTGPLDMLGMHSELGIRQRLSEKVRSTYLEYYAVSLISCFEQVRTRRNKIA